MSLIDTHCHPQYLIGENYREQQFIEDCSGLSSYLMVSVDASDFSLLKNLANKDQRAYYSIGIHPSHVHEESFTAVENWDFSDANLVALGETGLDYYHSTAHAQLQKEYFVQHLELGQQQRLPIIIHTRSAAEDTLALLKSHGYATGVIHCFTESLSFARKALDLGLYLSFAGIITFKNAEELREVVRFCPRDRILSETDAPFLAPVPFRGKENHPRHVEHVVKMIAQLKGMDYRETCSLLAQNTRSLFQKMK